MRSLVNVGFFISLRGTVTAKQDFVWRYRLQGICLGVSIFCSSSLLSWEKTFVTRFTSDGLIDSDLTTFASYDLRLNNVFRMLVALQTVFPDLHVYLVPSQCYEIVVFVVACEI